MTEKEKTDLDLKVDTPYIFSSYGKLMRGTLSQIIYEGIIDKRISSLWFIMKTKLGIKYVIFRWSSIDYMYEDG